MADDEGFDVRGQETSYGTRRPSRPAVSTPRYMYGYASEGCLFQRARPMSRKIETEEDGAQSQPSRATARLLTRGCVSRLRLLVSCLGASLMCRLRVGANGGDGLDKLVEIEHAVAILVEVAD